MKTKKDYIYLILGALLILGFLFLVYKVWNVFGFWNIILTVLISITFSILLNRIGSRKEVNNEIIYNPKEWPKYLNVFILIGLGYYLYTLLDINKMPKVDYYFGIAYLVVFVGIQMVYSAYVITYNRKDFVSVSNLSVKYKDNQEVGEIPLQKIVAVEKLNSDIKLTLLNDEELIIKTSNMNFNVKDLNGVIKDIQSKLLNKTA